MKSTPARRGPPLLGATLVIGAALLSRNAQAWGPDGHHTVAAIADKLLTGSTAASQVRMILGPVSLVDAAVWADCVKGVAVPGFSYEGAGRYPECAGFETASEEAAMIDFVKRNATNCKPKPTEEICHKQYHYADIAIQHDSYQPTFEGARTDDIASAVRAAITVLQGAPAPAPFSIKDKREALLLLVHYVGDIHQPLHVGAVYLDASGKPVDPDVGYLDPDTETRGGNEINVVGGHSNLHATWDAIPASLKVDAGGVRANLIAEAKAVPATKGKIVEWPVAWASDTQKQAVKALGNLTFGPKTGRTWSATLPKSYAKSMSDIKQTQLTTAGARLAQLLAAIWPDTAVSPAHGHKASPTP
jgi:S1/P1 Nuclease